MRGGLRQEAGFAAPAVGAGHSELHPTQELGLNLRKKGSCWALDVLPTGLARFTPETKSTHGHHERKMQARPYLPLFICQKFGSGSFGAAYKERCHVRKLRNKHTLSRKEKKKGRDGERKGW